MTTLRSCSPIKLTVPAGLIDLREQVLARETKGKPRWKFRIAPDVVLQFQPQSAKTVNVAIKTEDQRWERVPLSLLFIGAILVCEGAKAEYLVSTTGITVPHWKIPIEVGTDAAGDTVVIGGSWSGGYGRASPDIPRRSKEEWKAFWEECDAKATHAFMAALADGRFNRIGPAIMLTPNCVMCGKSLTDPISMARGIGPECAGTSSSHMTTMKNLGDAEAPEENFPTRSVRRPIKPPVLLTEAPSDAAPVKLIRSMDDVTLVPTPITYSRGNKKWTEMKPRALLFEGREKATIVAPNAMTGTPFIEHCKITLVTIEGRSFVGRGEAGLYVQFVKHGKRQTMVFDRDFPTDHMLIAWGHYAIDLTNLPTEDVHHHVWDGAMWAEVSRRFHAVAKHTVWLDTTQAACVARRAAFEKARKKTAA